MTQFKKILRITKEELEFLEESNKIEREYSKIALEDAITAWKYAKKYSKIIGKKYSYRKFTIEFILRIHKRLMKRLNPEIAGKIRDCTVYIGGKEKSLINKKEIIKQLNDWTEKWKMIYGYPIFSEHEIKMSHVEFEEIHPFVDGNGRTGRILMNLYRIYMGFPILIIHTGKEQKEYYSWWNNDRKRLK